MTMLTLDESFFLNPKVVLPKGTLAPFVDMGALRPFTRDVGAATRKPYTGGMKFLDGDVLMARITPSLENGKTSIYRAAPDDDGPAFGSTEFIVIRGREGISDSQYAYYLFTSPEVRDHAIASMNGSSGRQRVQQDSLAAFVIDLPPLDEQRAIAATLGALDDKIESNRRVRDLIWSLLGAQYASIAQDSVYRPLGNVVQFDYGKSLPATRRIAGSVPVFGSNGITGRHNAAITDAPAVIVGRKGSIGEVHWSSVPVFPIDTTFSVRPVRGYPMIACFFALRAAGLQAMNSDSAIPGLNRDRALSEVVRLPDYAVAYRWATMVQPLLDKAAQLADELNALERLRVTLLPELLSGRLRVAESRGAPVEAFA